jgi:DNA-binding NarL/FixJ family response regulator
MAPSHIAYRTAPDLSPLIAHDIQRAIAIVIQVRQVLTQQTERLDQLEGELRLLEVFRAAAIGTTNKEIANQVGVAEGTLISTLTRIYRKLGVRNRNEAAFTAWKRGII